MVQVNHSTLGTFCDQTTHLYSNDNYTRCAGMSRRHQLRHHSRHQSRGASAPVEDSEVYLWRRDAVIVSEGTDKDSYSFTTVQWLPVGPESNPSGETDVIVAYGDDNDKLVFEYTKLDAPEVEEEAPQADAGDSSEFRSALGVGGEAIPGLSASTDQAAQVQKDAKIEAEAEKAAEIAAEKAAEKTAAGAGSEPAEADADIKMTDAPAEVQPSTQSTVTEPLVSESENNDILLSSQSEHQEQPQGVEAPEAKSAEETADLPEPELAPVEPAA
ncbi:hypothetical protein CANCADRAFT_44226 [Tortispora caseinolytica NRRL Y-17796]|uniref:Uncharacterized protein n=1 Tax=Tortispora caseinolytica NRRL Y-17796 TaxID=767744 RepID=A0A1E4TFN1_9ASCO|nr:hypothetical protein CANCADRAFT_44226 [Tortispora caseinolytica NRRL Y-17796]